MSAFATRENLDLVRFLLARIDDDDAELRRLSRSYARGGEVPDPDADCGVRSVERLRAECATKRHIIGSMQQLLVLRDQPLEKPVREVAASVLRWMAAPYTDHIAYRTEWQVATRR